MIGFVQVQQVLFNFCGQIKKGIKNMEKCNQNLSIEEISSTFGNSDNISKCKSCSNFVYEDGLLTCKLLLESVGNK
jgi:hypothetical protein